MEERVNNHIPGVPPHLTDWLKDKEKMASYDPRLAEIDPKVLQHFAVDCIVTNHTHYNHIFKNCCCICDKQLTNEEIESVPINHFIVTCDDHRKSGHAFQIDIERKRLGFKPRNLV